MSCIEADSIVGEVMRARPQTIAVFLRRRMHCPGCTMAPFMTLADVAESYAIDLEALIGELRAVARAAQTGGRP